MKKQTITDPPILAMTKMFPYMKYNLEK